MSRKKSTYSLKKASEHIYYEAWMLFETISRLRVERDSTNANIYLDAFTIHTRNLYDFLYIGANARSDDIIAEDYIEDISLYKKSRKKKRFKSHFTKSK